MVESLSAVERGLDAKLLRATWSSLLLRKAAEHDAGHVTTWDTWAGSRETLPFTGRSCRRSSLEPPVHRALLVLP